MTASKKVVRHMLISFNAVFLLLSLGLIGLGVSSFVVTDFSSILKYVPKNLHEDKILIQDVGIAAITIGAVSAIVSFMGCCGAAKESRKILFTFMILMIVIFLAVLVSGVLAITRQELLREVVRKTLEAEASGNTTETGMLKFAHDQYDCCGIEDMPLCDRDYPPMDACPKLSLKCQYGCLRALWDKAFAPYMQAVAITLFVLSGIVLIGISFAAALFKSIERNDYSYVRQD